MSFLSVEGLGPLANIARALGLLSGDTVRSEWFADPGRYLSLMLRDPEQRAALLTALDELVAQGETLPVDDRGRKWVLITREGPVDVCAVVHEQISGTVELGVGSRIGGQDPDFGVDAYVPLLRVPQSVATPVTFVLGSSLGRVEVAAFADLDAPDPDAVLQGVGVRLDVPTGPGAPDPAVLTATLRGLLTGADGQRADVTLGEGGVSELPAEALNLAGTVLRTVAGDAVDQAAAILGILGLGGHAAIPPLPIQELLSDGVPALERWLDSIVRDAAALQAWIGQFAALITTSLPPARAPVVAGDRISWSLASGARAGLIVRATPGPGGTTVLEIGGFAGVSATAAAVPPAAASLNVTATRITLGPSPAVTGLPSLTLSARLGPPPEEGAAAPLVPTTALANVSVEVKAVRIGLQLGEDRRPKLMLAAEGVQITAGAQISTYPVLDLTRADSIADVGVAVIDGVIDDLFDLLGPAAARVRVALGIDAPAVAGWPVPLVPLVDLLASPLESVLDYHRRVLRDHPDGYIELLGAMSSLFAAAAPGAATGSGTDDDPWKVEFAQGVSIAAWKTDTGTGELHLGLAVDRMAIDLGGSCPTVAVGMRVELTRIDLTTLNARGLGSIDATILFGARGGVPLRVGVDDAAIVADRIGLRVSLVDGAIAAALAAPGLLAELDGEAIVLALPTVREDGTFDAAVPWPAIERLAGMLLTHSGPVWAERLAAMLGWTAGQTPRLRLQATVADPLSALADFLTRLPAESLVRFLSILVNGPASRTLPVGLTLGIGFSDVPLMLPFAGTGIADQSFAFFSITGHAAPLRLGRFRPASLVALVTGATPTLPTSELGARLAGMLASGATQSGSAYHAMYGREDLATGLGALADRFAAGDGLVRADQATFAGALLHEVEAGHGALPALNLSTLIGAPTDEQTLFITLAPAWPGFNEAQVIDLSAPGLPAAAFNMTQLVEQTGPWVVRLPTRRDATSAAAEDATEAQAARLSRAVGAVVARAGGAPAVSLIALGGAGHAARIAAATAPGVSRLVTLGTPHGGIDLAVLDTGPAAQALQLLASVVPAATLHPELASLRAGRDLLEPLLEAYRAGDLAPEDLSPPPIAAPPLPGGVEAHAVVGRLGAAAAQSALAALVARGLQYTFESEEEARRINPPAALPTVGLGRRFKAGSDIVVTVDSRLDLWTVGTAEIDPVLVAKIDVGRRGGFLAGGPDATRPVGTQRNPSLRRAETELSIPLLRPEETVARFVLHDAEAFGEFRARWEISRSPDGTVNLDANARVLLGRAFAALGPLPPSGPVRQLVDVLSALDLLTAAPSVGGDVGLSVDAVELLVTDSAAFFESLRARRGAATLATALAGLVGAPAPNELAPGAVSASTDGVTLTSDLLAGSFTLSVTDLELHSGVRLTGSLTLDADGIRGSAQFDVADSGVRLDIASAPLAVSIRAADGGPLATAVSLYPAADVAGLARLLAAAVPAQILSAGITFVRTIDPAVNALLDPLLEALGVLVRGAEQYRVRVPLALMTSPRAWLERATVLGGAGGVVEPERLIALVDALGNLAGAAGVSPGSIVLPAGVTLSAEQSASGAAQLTLHAGGTPGGGLRFSGGVSITLPEPGASPALGLDAAVGLDGPGPIESSSRLSASIEASGASLTLILASGSQIALLPAGPGLAASAGSAAVTYALPLALDAIVANGGTAGNALGGLGTALALRPGGSFSGDEILLLAGDPATQLASRLRTGAGAAFAPLADLINPSFPAEWAAAGTPSALTITRAGTLSITITAPSSALVALNATAGPITVFPNATVTGSIELTDAGLRRMRALFEVDAAAPLLAGPVSIAPSVEFDVGPDAVDGAHVSVSLANAASRLEARFALGPPLAFSLEAPGAASLELGALQLLLPMTVDLALWVDEVTDLLAEPVLASGGVPATTTATLLDGALLQTVGTRTFLDPAALDPVQLLPRVLRLAGNLAAQAPTIAAGPLSIRLGPNAGDPSLLGITLSIVDGQRFIVADGDVQVALEVDATWIDSAGDGGIRVDLLRIAGAAVSVEPGFAIRGVGVRFMRQDQPLIDSAISIGSIALHGYVGIGATGVDAGGGQIELGSMSVALGGGSGDKVASGILDDASSGSQKPQAAFSPALSVQVGPPPEGLRVGLRAGPGDGPWWLGIRHSFGPVYIEQIGIGVEHGPDGPRTVSVMVDGKVSMLGLTVSVDDLALIANVDQPLHLPSSWEVSLAGLSVGADMGGVKIAGGLRRGSGAPDYLGMLTVRWAVYGITAFGGYAVKTDEQGEYTSFFLFGAVNAPIGGVPAFFVTGIGAGIGINRLLVLPDDFSMFTSYPFIAALDPNSPIASNPDEAMNQLQIAFPSGRGRFWLAAGVSFTSFTLVQGIAVIAVEIGDGFQIALLGLARTALPRPEATLVQIELALLARFSTRDGILWIQGQLTEESWLLTRDCRLTGGFAYVMWFKGDRAGEFVLTMGGYHPSFRREGYPEVPRIGFVWNVASMLVIKGESYFALTSEAIMAGARFEARLDAGLLWAYIIVGADGIVYFDPFWFQVSAYAEMGAGITITIDLGFLGKIRIEVSVHLSGQVVLEGPAFRGRAVIDLDVASAEVSFGDWSGARPPDLLWPAFRTKYLVQSDNAAAAADILSVAPGLGQQAGSPGGDRKPPTGGSTDPFAVVPEFTFEVRSRAAASDLTAGANVAPRITNLAVAPMGRPGITSRITATLVDSNDNAQRANGELWIDSLVAVPVRDRFPKGVWVARPDPQAIPGGDLVEAYSGWRFEGRAAIVGVTPEIDYHQIETGPRKPLPFAVEIAERPQWQNDLGNAVEVDPLRDVGSYERYALLEQRQIHGALGSGIYRSAARARPAYRAPPQLAPVAAGSTQAPLKFAHAAAEPPPKEQPPKSAAPPRLEGRLVLSTREVEAGRSHTTVSGERRQGLVPIQAPSAGELRSRLAASHGARLVTRSAAAVECAETVLAPFVPVTGRAGSGFELRRTDGRKTLETVTGRFLSDGVDVTGGEILVFRLPGAADPYTESELALPSAPRIELEGPARLIFFQPMGIPIASVYSDAGGYSVPEGTERFIVIAGTRASDGNIGWHADTTLAQIGATTFVGPGCTLRGSSATTWRRGQTVHQALVRAGDIAAGYCRVDTTFDRPVRSVALIFEAVAGDASTEDIEMELTGASRPADSSPLVVVAAGRTVAVYDIVPDEGVAAVDVSVSVTSRIQLAGVVGATEAAGPLAEHVAGRGTDRLVQPLARPARALKLRWIPPATPDPLRASQSRRS